MAAMTKQEIARATAGPSVASEVVDPRAATRMQTEMAKAVARDSHNTTFGVTMSYKSVEVVQMIRQSMQSMADTARKYVGADEGLLSAAQMRVPQAASGGFVKQSGLAVIHKGETINPADQVSSNNTTVTNYVTATVNNKTDEKYLMDLINRRYYGAS
jgi:hypothetical protein